jgi:hypothetical protein
MADHELVWEYTGGTVTPRPQCHAPVTADCRIEWVCGCETLIIVARDEDGPYHQAADAKHYGKPGGECNVVTWMDNDEDLTEACIGALSFTIGRTPIEPVWTGDWYEWKPLQ